MKKTILFVLVLTLCMAVEVAKANFVFGEPTHVDKPVSSESWEYSVCVSPDGRELFFSSVGIYGWHDLFVVDRESPNDSWSNKRNLGVDINSDQPDSCPSISGDGLSLYFSRGDTSAATIWNAKRKDYGEPWEPATMLGPMINKGSSNGTPDVSADGLSLYFARREAGNLDIFVATRTTTTDQWDEAVPLPPHINTQYDEGSPYITPDGRYLLFCSSTRDYSNDVPRPDGVGEADIWMAKRMSASDEWEEPVSLPVPIVGMISQDMVCIKLRYFPWSI